MGISPLRLIVFIPPFVYFVNTFETAGFEIQKISMQMLYVLKNVFAFHFIYAIFVLFSAVPIRWPSRTSVSSPRAEAASSAGSSRARPGSSSRMMVLPPK